MNNLGYLGTVWQGRFQPLATERGTADPLRLTSVPMQAAQSPESGELSLTDYEGSAIMVRGVDSGEWIYSAVVVDQAGPILTAVVIGVFSPTKGQGQYRLMPLRR